MELLDQIILGICCIIDVFFLFDFYKNAFVIRDELNEKRYVFLISSIAAGILFLLNKIGNPFLNLVGAPCILWVYNVILFRAGIRSRFAYFLMSYAILFGCEFLYVILLEIPVIILRNTSVLALSEIPWQMFTMKLLQYILFSIVKRFSYRQKQKMSLNIFMVYLIQPISSFGLMLLTYYFGIAFDNILLKCVMTIFFFSILIGNIAMFYTFNRYCENVQKNMEQQVVITKQEMDLKHYVQIGQLNDKHNQLIHDTSHYLKVIGELVRNDEKKKALEIISDLSGEFNEMGNYLFCHHAVLNVILNEKKIFAEKSGIFMDIYIEPGINLGQVTDKDLITMVENLLDNSIRAAKESGQNQAVKVRMFMQNDSGFFVCKISNAFSGNLQKDGDEFKTTKKENGLHGIGIKSVKTTAEKYGGFLECFVEEKIFTAVLVLMVK